MRFMGIDFGARRVGVAVSDETNSVALPAAVLANDRELVAGLKAFIKEKNIGTIVIGESKNFQGEANAIMTAVERLKTRLESETGLPICYEPELLTSAEAERVQGKTKMHDASAAALILKSYLEKTSTGRNIQHNGN